MNQPEKDIDIYKKSTMVQMRAPTVKNRSPNPVQITAEMLISDPEIHQLQTIKMPVQHLVGQDEVMSYKAGKRKEFEEILRRQKFHMGTWVKYAEWEAALQEFRRARSIFERALDVSATHPSIWMRYIEMEMKHKFIDHARNLFERATAILPRVDQFWFKYIYMEELLANYQRARAIFEKWMSWNPTVDAWVSFAAFETRMGEPELARDVMHRFLEANPKLDAYIRVAKYEEKRGSLNEARRICERAIEEIAEEALDEELIMLWAKLERKAKEIQRARELYEFGLKSLPSEKAKKLKEEYSKFQNKFGNEQEIDSIVLEKRRQHYKALLLSSPYNYNAWFDLAALEEASEQPVSAREVYASVMELTPLESSDRTEWKRYMYLAVAFAAFEELIMSDLTRARVVLENCAKVLPHKKFSFSKIWMLLAQCYIRSGDLAAARLVFGKAIGLCGSKKVFKAYADMESQLGNFDRCRKIYEKQLEIQPAEPESWLDYFEFEAKLGEIVRARHILSSAIETGFVKNPEILWKKAIDFEIEQDDQESVARLYEELLAKSAHVKVFLSYALFYFSKGEFEEARKIFQRAEEHFKQHKNLREERALLLENWFQCELKAGDSSRIEELKARLPTKVKKQRVIHQEGSDDISDYRYEEYFEYVFKEDLTSQKGTNLQKLAQKWKQKDGS